MARLVRDGKKLPIVRHIANMLTSDLTQKDWLAEIKTLHAFVRDRIRYVRDVNGVETLHTPDKILEYKQGDCDDKSVLLASMLEAIGHKTRLVAIGFSPNRYSHVFPEVLYRGKWIPLETTEPVDIGWTPKNVQARMIVQSNTLDGLAGTKVDAVMMQAARKLSELLAQAQLPEATEEEKAYAEEMKEKFKQLYMRYLMSERKKKKSFTGKLTSAWEDRIKVLGHISPSMHAHAQHIDRADELKKLQMQMIAISAQPPSPERDDKLKKIQIRMGVLSKKEKNYMNNGKIVAAIASVVVGVFTFGGGSAVISGAVEAIKQGAIGIAKGMLLGAATSALTKGANPKDVEQAQQAANVIEQYPPNPNLDTLDQMVSDSYAQKQIRDDKLKTVAAVSIPVGIAVLTLI